MKNSIFNVCGENIRNELLTLYRQNPKGVRETVKLLVASNCNGKTRKQAFTEARRFFIVARGQAEAYKRLAARFSD